MALERLSLRDFRCFTRLETEFHPQITYIVGRNAIGKTSLLEAIAVLLRLQSPRTGSLQNAIRAGGKGLVVDGFVDQRHLQFYYSPRRRKLALDSVEQKTNSDYLEIARVVYLANSDIDLIRGPAEGRRRFLDFIGAQCFANYREILRSYEKALRSRNAYLKMYPARPREVGAYTKVLLKFGHQLTALRAFLIERLEPEVLRAFATISDRGESVCLRYSHGATTDFERALRDSAAEEARLHTTVVGPHRDDVQFLLHDLPADLFASEGQQRTLAVALRLAQTKLLATDFARPPILLLDDVFGELDQARRQRLLQQLPSGSQRVITTTGLDRLAELPEGLVCRFEEGAHAGERVLTASPTP
ncbi:MAG: DNA replication/repair protein RecF [Verrucomicrobia bacterium]|nr:DNA replication/repair protein RecF [Verrucomicrobiota bacterium]